MGDVRTVKELVSLYYMEPSLCEIFTEGSSDKVLIEKFLKKNGISPSKVKVTEIDEIDFSDEEDDSIRRNNKKKLIHLSKALEIDIDTDLLGVSLIIDHDFDHITGNVIRNKYLNYYDYNSLELYCWSPDVLDDYFSMVLRGFRFNGAQTLESIKEPLIKLFLLRACFEIMGTIPEGGLVDFNKSLNFRKDGSIIFDHQSYLVKNLNKANEMKNKASYHKILEDLKPKLHHDEKMNIRGHDFIDMLVSYINNFKKSHRSTTEILENTIFQSIDLDSLGNTPLFKSLVNKYQ
ncbi:DUF4435 domain-containing protein [Vibrio fluvialis]